jgi:Na+/H+-dicarboxylate symporter
MSLSSKIAWSLVLGIGAGIFFGELMAPLDVVATAFIKLLQMTVLPYVMVSLIAGLGGLSLADARSIARNVGALLLVLWGVVLVVVLVIPLSFPDWTSASFYSTSLIRQPEPFDFLDLYIPANPFRSLADNVVPAVVLFSAVVGIALIGVADKAPLVNGLKILGKALGRVTDFVVELTPLGIFAIAASAAGTMRVEEFERLQVFMISYVAAAGLLTFWILPGLITAVTPFRYREVMGLTRDALITAFMTGSLFVVLPILTQTSKRLMREHGLAGEEADAIVDVVVPASFNFPNSGKLLSLLFVMFAGWFSGNELSAGQLPQLFAAGLVSLFGNVNVAIPFLLDLVRIPADMFQLFIVSGLINARFGTLLAAVHTLVLALVGTCAIIGAVRFDTRRVLRYVAISTGLLFAVVVGLRTYFEIAVDNEYTLDRVLQEMHLVQEGVPHVVHRDPLPPLSAPTMGRMAAIRERGQIRVGYTGMSIPYSFFNASGDLVGLDIELAHRLAAELGVAIEFVPVDRLALPAALAAGCCDIVMGGYSMTTERAMEMVFSQPYLDETLAFIMPDHRRDDFADLERIRRTPDLRIAVPPLPYYVEKLRKGLPDAEIVPVETPEALLADWPDDIDASLTTAERGSAMSLLHPHMAVAVPLPAIVRAPLAYPMPHGDEEFVRFVDNWIELKKRDDTITRARDYWVLGKAAVPTRPRWSIVRNVLGWVE